VGYGICGQVLVGVSPVLKVSREKSSPRYQTSWPTKLENVCLSVCLPGFPHHVERRWFRGSSNLPSWNLGTCPRRREAADTSCRPSLKFET
jgi:hypothetical protein